MGFFKSAGKIVKKVSNFVSPDALNIKLVKGVKKYVDPDTGESVANPDNLRSEDNLEVLIGLCEGPIVGLEKGEESFYIGDTALKNLDGSKNFEDYELEVKIGDESADETINLKQGGVANGHVLNRELTTSEDDATSANSWFVSLTTDTGEIDFIDVRIGISSLYNMDGEGNVGYATGKFRIEYKKESEAGWHIYNNKDVYIDGKTTSNYYKDYRITVEPTTDEKYQVKVTRLSPKSSASTTGYFFKMEVTQIEEVTKVYNEFKNTAIAHLNIRTSDQITSIPQMYGIYKLLKIKVPSNYNPETHTYSGLWDGTFKIAWTDNPAWCLYDLIVNDRYGVNAYYSVIPDKWDFYEAGKYCDEPIDDGKGGTEPRYTLNYLITESQSGPEMLNYIADTFNAVIYEDSQGLVRLAFEDNKKQAVQIFNPTNVTSEGFTYSFSDPSSRYNDFTVTFLNPNLNWEEDRRRVITPYGSEEIDKFGRIPYDFNAIGCTKESEAIRKAQFKLITSLKETMSVTFSTNRAATNVNLFDTILIADPDMGYSQTGRIKSISEDRATIYLRDSVFIETNSAYEIQIQTSYNVFRCGVNIREYGPVKELKLDTSLPDNIYEKAVFTLSGTDSIYGNPKPFRVMSISENQGNPDEITITATEIHRLKQEEADYGVELYDEEYNTSPNVMIVPQLNEDSVQFNEYFNVKRLENALQISVTLDWDRYPYYTGRFLVYSRLKDGDDPSWIQRKVEDGDTIYSHPAGLYEFKILPLNTLGLSASLESAPIFEFEISDIAAEPPADVTNFIAEGNVENIHLTWDKVPNAVRYEIRLGEEWETADIIEANILPTSGLTEEYYYTDVDDDNTYKFLIKAVNVAGLYSEYATVTYGKLSAPADVKKFYITPNLDSLRFDWETDNENYVSYEVRTGSDLTNGNGWDSATKLFVTQGNNQTVLNPGFNDDTYFYIKGISRKGIYSENALWGKIKQNLKQNRNVVLKVDNAEGELNYFIDSPEAESQTLTPWYGVTHGLIDAIVGTKAMVDGYPNAEHFFPIHLPSNRGDNEKTIARNWYDIEFFKFGERLKWQDLTWAWNSEEAKTTSWLNSDNATSYGGEIESLITTKKDDSDYTNYLGFRFNGTTKDVTNSKSPSNSYKVAYVDGKYDKGLAIYKAMKLNYTLTNFSPTFSFRFKVYLNPSVPDFLKLVRLQNSNNILDVFFENSQIKLSRSDGIKLSIPFNSDSYLDYMFVMITQSEHKLSLDYFIEYANIREKREIECEPLTTFTKLYFGGRYD